MTNALILYLTDFQHQKGFAQLASEFGQNYTRILHNLLIERMITEAFPLEGSYQLILASPRDKAEIGAFLGENWQNLGPFFTLQEGGQPIQQIIDQTFAIQSIEKLIVLQVGNHDLDEAKISELFQELSEINLFCGFGSDHSLISLGLHRCHVPLLEAIQFSDDHLSDLLPLRAEHFKKTCRVRDENLVPEDLAQLATYRDSLPTEHFIAHKIDQMVLEKLDPTANHPD